MGQPWHGNLTRQNKRINRSRDSVACSLRFPRFTFGLIILSVMTHKRPAIDLAAELLQIVTASSWFRDLGLPTWCIGAGAVRHLVWEQLKGYAQSSHLADVGLVYFDPLESGFR